MTGMTTCLWFDKNGEEAANFYVGIFPDSRIDPVNQAPMDYPSGKKGDVLTVDFTLMGRPFVALNGGPDFKFNEAISIMIECDDQAEVDRYSEALSAVPESEICGWVKDKYGLSWQIAPRILLTLMKDPDQAKAKRVMNAMMEMKKIDVAAIEKAAAG